LVGHAAFKGLVFAAAGAIAHGAGTRDLERMGGLARRMPATAALMAIGCAAASAVPGLSGFVGEWLAYRGLFAGLQSLPRAGQVAATAGVTALALTGALAAAAFARAYGIACSGAPRSEEAARAHEGGLGLLVPMALLALP